MRLVLATFLSGIVIWLSAQKRPWAFVQAVGGIEVMAPVRDGHGWRLPVNCNVSGLKRITREPTQLNSALVIRSIDVESRGGDLWVSVVTCLAGEGRGAGGLHYADVSNLRPGRYRVFYGREGDTAHAIGSVVIPSR